MAQLAPDPSSGFMRPSRKTGCSAFVVLSVRSQPICRSPLGMHPTWWEGGTLRSKHRSCPPCSSASQSSSLR